jgi:hypothetical protein
MKGTDTVNYNGQEVMVKDIDDPGVRHLLGYGHDNPYNRPVVPFDYEISWPFTPDTCEVADEPGHTKWTASGHALVCMGCGLDCT